MINAEDAVYDELRRQNAVRSEIDCGSFKIVVVDQKAVVGGRAAIEAMPVNWSDEQNMILFNGYVIDTSASQPLSKELPADLKRSRMAEARARGANPDAGLYVVQFAGPIQDAWLETLESTGADVISYVSNNAYVVRCDARSAALVLRMKDEQKFVQWADDYQPAYKLDQATAAARAMGATGFVKVTVQTLDSVEGNQQAFNLRNYSRQFIGERRVMKYRNITAVIPASQLTEHAFRVREPADKPVAEYASHKVFIRDARDADSWP